MQSNARSWSSQPTFGYSAQAAPNVAPRSGSDPTHALGLRNCFRPQADDCAMDCEDSQVPIVDLTYDDCEIIDLTIDSDADAADDRDDVSTFTTACSEQEIEASLREIEAETLYHQVGDPRNSYGEPQREGGEAHGVGYRHDVDGSAQCESAARDGHDFGDPPARHDACDGGNNDGMEDSDAESTPHSPEFTVSYRVIRELTGGASGSIFVCRRYNADELMNFANGVALERGRVHRTDRSAERLIAKRVRANSRESIMLENEITVLQVAQHENIVKFVGVERYTDHVYLLTPKFNYDLYEYLEDEELRGLYDIVKIIRQVLAAIEHLHSKRIIHRDIKLENIFLNNPDRVVVGDMGAAVPFQTPLTPQDHGWAGTVATNSPEMLARDSYCELTDIWSCGVVMLELITNKVSVLGRDSRNSGTHLRSIIRRLSICPSEFPAEACNLTTQFIDLARGSRTPFAVPSIVRRLELPADVEYAVTKMLSFDWRRRPSASAMLGLPAFGLPINAYGWCPPSRRSRANQTRSWRASYDSDTTIGAA